MAVLVFQLFFIFCIIISNTFQVLLSPIDLTWSFENSTIYWPGIRNFEFTKTEANITEQKFWYAMNEFCAGEHGGTHLDAPYHFFKDGKKVGDIPLNRLIAKGILIDISEEVAREGGNRNLLESDLNDWVKKYGSIDDNSVVLIKFGWSKYYPDKKSYLGIGDDLKLNFPSISPEAALWLASSQKIIGVGVDVASVDPGSSTTFEAHRTLAAADIYNLENVKLLDDLPVRNFTLLVMPMNIQHGTGAPLRLIAVQNVQTAFVNTYLLNSGSSYQTID